MIAEIRKALLAITGVAEKDKKDVMILAAANTAQLDGEFTALEKEIAENTKETVFEELDLLLKAWGLTANVGWRKVGWISAHQMIPTTYEIAFAAAELNSSSYDEALKLVCHDHYPLRVAFNKAVKGEELFKYVAFNIGNLGLQSFGEFCFFVDNATAAGFVNLVFLKGNSLDCYAIDGQQLDMGSLEQDIAIKSLVEKLVAIKHREDIVKGHTGTDWVDKVCNGDGYVEGLLIDDLTINKVNCVKIDKKIDDGYTTTAINLQFGGEVSSDAADMLHNYINAKAALKELGLTIQIV